MTPEALAPLATALLIGLLIGLDRERAEARKQRKLFAGIRTFPLIALAGALPMQLADGVGPWLLVVSFLAVAAIVLVAYRSAAATGAPGATTEIAAVTTFLLGAVAGAGHLAVAAAVGVAVSVILAAKPPLEAFSRALTRAEVIAMLQLAVITLVVLPVLPDRAYGPWEVLNPRRIWLVVVLVSTLSLCGFVAMRLLGAERGTLLAGAVGGLVSSTAVTLAMAQRSRTSPAVARATAAATTIASAIMCCRIVLLVGAIAPRLLPALALPIGSMATVGFGAAFLLVRHDRRTAGDTPAVRNPFSLTAAVTFAGIYAVVLLAIRAAQEFLDARGLYVAAVLGGLANVDAPTLAFARLADQIAPATAVTAIVLAAVSNTLLKLGMAVGLGGGRFRGFVGIALGAMVLAGAAGSLVLWRG